jgi:hypothetical protein
VVVMGQPLLVEHCKAKLRMQLLIDRRVTDEPELPMKQQRRASGHFMSCPSRAGLTFSIRASGPCGADIPSNFCAKNKSALVSDPCGADTHRLNRDSLLIPCSVYAKE